MILIRGTDSKTGKGYYSWGKLGKRYHYTIGNDPSRKRAKTMAKKCAKCTRGGKSTGGSTGGSSRARTGGCGTGCRCIGGPCKCRGGKTTGGKTTGGRKRFVKSKGFNLKLY